MQSRDAKFQTLSSDYEVCNTFEMSKTMLTTAQTIFYLTQAVPDRSQSIKNSFAQALTEGSGFTKSA